MGETTSGAGRGVPAELGGARGETDALTALGDRIERCRRCPRLRGWCGEVARVRRAAYADERYWGRPVRGFGDARARIVVCGLAPGAHGANRTGRVFTGDRSGEFLYAALHRAGLANQARASGRDDGLQLRDVWVTVAVRCAPPGNKPTPAERDACAPFLVEELALLPRARVVVCLGAFAWEAMRAAVDAPRARFAHGARVQAGAMLLLGSYHVSQQNVFTGKLTPRMFDAVLADAKREA